MYLPPPLSGADEVSGQSSQLATAIHDVGDDGRILSERLPQSFMTHHCYS
jgi:hypothetical protein